MTSKKNGELPAFAVPLDVSKYHTDTGVFPAGCGLTKREYFAAMAMQGLLANSKLWENLEAVDDSKYHNWFAEQSTKYAEELLKALES